MANTKLDRIERDIEKTRAKVLEYQKRLTVSKGILRKRGHFYGKHENRP